DPPVYGFRPDVDVWTEEAKIQASFVPVQQTPIANSVSELTLSSAVSDAYGAGGEFWDTIADSSRLVHNLNSALPIRARVADVDFYEREDILVRLGPWIEENRGRSLWVTLFRVLPREALPTFLRDYYHEDDGVPGIFDVSNAPAGSGAGD